MENHMKYDWSTPEQVFNASDSVKNSVHAAQVQLSNQAEVLGIASIASTERNGQENRGNTDRNGAECRRETELFGFQNINASRMEGAETRDEVEKFGFKNSDDVLRSSYRTQDSVEKFGFYNAGKIDSHGFQNFQATKEALKDVLLQACHNTDKIICNDNSNAKDMQMKLCQLELEQAKNTAAIQLEASKNKCAIELEAARNQAIMMAKISECCCETRSLIIEKSNDTDSLLRKLDEQRVRDELARTREELIALRVRASLPPPLVASIPL